MVEVLVLGSFALAAGATAYQRRSDVLYGGYVMPPFWQRWSAIVGPGEA